MRVINIILIGIIFEFGFTKVVDSQTITNFNDTSYLKNVKYEKLNNLVSYNIISNGRSTGKSGVAYIIKPVASYYYYSRSYEKDNKDTLIHGKSDDVAKLVLSNKFSNRFGFNGIFKINSKAMLVYKPWILKKMTVTPNSSDTSSLRILVSKLKIESFISEVSLKTSDLQWIGGVRKNIYVTILLKPGYRNIESEKEIKKELKKWSGIADVSSSADLFTGNSEYETIFIITSQEKK